MIITVLKRHNKVTLTMDNMLLFGLVLITTIGTSFSQSCPEIPNVARVCTSATYSGARVLMDTSYFTETVQNCSCTFSTTADTIRIVTYAAPSYRQCNSAIRFYSNSGNSMRFQCMMSGTMLDTSIYKDGGADLETYGSQYDTNYCLVLEHLGTTNDSISITCQGTESADLINATDVISSNEDITTTTPFATDMSTPMATDGNTDNGTNSNTVEITSLEAVDNASTKNTWLNNGSSDLSAESNSVQNNTEVIASITTVNNTSRTGDINFITNIPTATTVEPDTVDHTRLLQGNTTEDTRSLDTLTVRNVTNLLSQKTDMPIGSTNITADIVENESNITKDISTRVISEKQRDISTFDTVNRENTTGFNEHVPDIIYFGNDAIPKDEYNSQTSTNNPRKLWTGAVVVRNRTVLSSDGISFGNDSIPKESFTPQPDVFTTGKIMTFVNDAIVKHTNSYETTTSMQHDTNSNTIKATTNISHINTNNVNEGGSFSSRNEFTTLSSTPSYADNVTEQYAHTFGPDIVAREKVAFGRDAIPFEPTVESRIPFGADILPKEHLSHDVVNDTNAFPLLEASEVTMENSTIVPDFESGFGKQTFGNDAIPITRTTSSSKTSAATLQTTTKGIETAVFHDKTGEINAFDHIMTNDVKTTEAYEWTTGSLPTEIVTFGNDAISKENLTFGNDAMPKDAMPVRDIPLTPGVVTTGESGTIEVDAFGNDVVTRETNHTLNKETIVLSDKRNDLPFPLTELAFTGTTILPINIMSEEKAAIENDALSKGVLNVPTTTSDPWMFGETDSKTSFGNDAIVKDGFISSSGVLNEDQATFGIDAISKDIQRTDATPSATFGNDAITKETNATRNIETLMLNNTHSNDISLGRRDGENTTEPIAWSPAGNANDKFTFGNDAITKHMTTARPQAVTTEITSFGNDIIPKETLNTVANPKEVFGDDMITKEPTPTKNIETLVLRNRPIDNIIDGRGDGENTTAPMEWATVGIISDRSTFGNDAITRTGATSGLQAVTTERTTFGNDAIAWNGISHSTIPTVEKSTFGSDAIPSEAGFGNDVLIKDANSDMGKDINVPSERPIDTISFDTATFGNDAIAKIGISQSTIPTVEKSIFGSEAIPSAAGFGNDVLIKDANSDMGKDINVLSERPIDTISFDTATFGNDAIAKIGISQSTIPTVEKSTFGNDVLTKDATSDMGKDINFLNERPIDTISFDTATFGIDAAAKVIVTTKPDVASTEKRTTFGNDAVIKGNDILILDTKSRDTITFDSITSNTVISTDEPVWATDKMATDGARFGGDALMKEPDISLSFGNDVTAKPIDKVPFGNDAILKEAFSENAAVSETIKVDASSLLLGSLPRDTIMSEPNTAGILSTTESPLITNIMPDENTAFGNDAILKDMHPNTNRKSIVASEFPSDNITRDDGIDFTNDVAPMENAARGILIDNLQINETVPSLANDIITERRQTFGDDIVMKSDSLVRSTFGSDVVNKDIRTTTYSSVMEPHNVDNALSVLGNIMNSHNTDTFTSSQDVLVSDTHNNVFNEHNMAEAMLESDVTITTSTTRPIPPPTTTIPVNEPVIEEILAKEIDTSLLNRFNQVKPDHSNSLMDSLFNTHKDTVSSFDTHPLNSIMGTDTFDRVPIGPDTVTGNMINDIDNTLIELTTVSTDIAKDIVNEEPNFDVVVPKLKATMSIFTDSISTEELATTTPQRLSESTLAQENAKTTPELKSEPTTTTTTTTTTNQLTSSTQITRVTQTATDVVKTKSTLPDIIPADSELFEPLTPRQEIDHVVKVLPTTQQPSRTTKKVYAVLVDEAAVINRPTIVDDSSNTKTSQDQLNVAFDDEPNNSLFDTNNKTNIIIVIAAAGTIVMVAVIAVVICNKRKSRSAKVDLNNGVSATNHNNAAFDNDVSEAERGNAPSNGVDLPPPTVEVIEPSVNGIDTKVPGGS